MPPAPEPLLEQIATCWDVVVVGAGPAGALAAHGLASRGVRVLLVEQRHFPRWKVCGACLSPQALAVLEAAGLAELVAAEGGIHLQQLQLGIAGLVSPIALGGGRVLSRSRLDLGLLQAAKAAGATVLTGGKVEQLSDDLNGGYYIQPTILKGTNDMRVFQEEIFGPVISMSTFKDEAEALRLANSSEFGLGAGVWTRNTNRAYQFGRKIEAGRVWTNCYHMYPAHAAFGGYKKSGIGRETHKLALNHYQQTKNLLVSYSEDPLGFF